ncbi:hypothetical protein NDU88_001842 [Pleurodeles waltl]|uniref:Uncharacterized protein n=1 Tax=Pleurodeles waltl TaxID=8319 RepID=A0AAV7NLD3_PLEWA|nr:hypothetical protein NDU88_001842 [Pleurodeles waltl]
MDLGGLLATRDLPRPRFRHLPGYAPVLRPDSGTLTAPGDTSRAQCLHNGTHMLVFLTAGSGARKNGSYMAAILAPHSHYVAWFIISDLCPPR